MNSVVTFRIRMLTDISPGLVTIVAEVSRDLHKPDLSVTASVATLGTLKCELSKTDVPTVRVITSLL